MVQPLWKICSSKRVHLPQSSGWKPKKYLSCHHRFHQATPRLIIKSWTGSYLILLQVHLRWCDDVWPMQYVFLGGSGKFSRSYDAISIQVDPSSIFFLLHWSRTRSPFQKVEVFEFGFNMFQQKLIKKKNHLNIQFQHQPNLPIYFPPYSCHLTPPVFSLKKPAFKNETAARLRKLGENAVHFTLQLCVGWSFQSLTKWIQSKPRILEVDYLDVPDRNLLGGSSQLVSG